MKKPNSFPYEYKRGGRVAKVYFLKGPRLFKTRFYFAQKEVQNTLKTWEATVEYLERELSKLDTNSASAVSLHPLNHDPKTYSELEQLLRNQAPGFSLRDTVTFFLTYHTTHTLNPMTVEACAAKFITARKPDVSPIQIQTLEKHFRRFCEDFGDREIHKLGASEIHDWLNRQTIIKILKSPFPKNSEERDGIIRKEKTDKLWSPKTRTSVLASLASLATYAQKTLRAIPNNGMPTEFQNVPKPKKPDRAAVDIYTPAEIQLLLMAAIESDIDLLPVVVLGAFQGLRPFEIHAEKLKRDRLKWEALDWKKKIIYIRGQKVRSKATRQIPFHKVTRAWLEPFRTLKGIIWTLEQSHTKRMIALRKAAGVRSIFDGLRHSYGSFRVAQLDQNLSLVAAEMGNSPEELINSYKENVDKEEAEAWFNCMPPVGYAEKIKLALLHKDERTNPSQSS